MKAAGLRLQLGVEPIEREMSSKNAAPNTLLSEQAFASLRGCTSDFLVKARDAHRIFCVNIDGVPLYPSFYADQRFNRRQLGAITKVLGDLTGGSKWLFFTRPKGSLGSVTPLRALLKGRFAEVRATAEGYAER